MARVKLPLFAYLITIIALWSCSSGKSAFEHGNYYEAVITSVNRLRKNDDHAKSMETLRQAYPMAVTFYEDRAKASLASNAEFKWTAVVESYTTINVMYDEIRRCPGALKVIPNPLNYYAKLEEAKKNAAEENYVAGIAAMTTATRDKAKLAYGLFKKTNGFVPGYKDVIKMMETALWNATVKVVMEPIPVQAKNIGVSAEFFDDKVSEYVHSASINEFVKFYTRKEAQTLKLNPDHIIKIEFDEFVVGQVFMNEKETKLEKDSVVVGTYVANTSGTTGGKTGGKPTGGKVGVVGAGLTGGSSSGTTGGSTSGTTGGKSDSSGGSTGGNTSGTTGGTSGGNTSGTTGGNTSGTTGGATGGNSSGTTGGNTSGTTGGNTSGTTGGTSGGNTSGTTGGNTSGTTGGAAGGNTSGTTGGNTSGTTGGAAVGSAVVGGAASENTSGGVSDSKDKDSDKDKDKDKGNDKDKEKEKGDKDQDKGSDKDKEKDKDANDDQDTTKVTVCHIPPGNEASKHSLVISRSALKAHLAHGDTEGACDDGKKIKDVKPKGKSSGPKASGNKQPVFFASTDNDPMKWLSYLEDEPEADTTKVYMTVKATFYYYKKTTTSKGVISFKIIDAKTNALLSVEKMPGEYVWISEWATFNGDERALSPQQLQLTKQREKVPPPAQDLFIEFTKPIYNQVTTKIKNFYSGY